ncbi:hypothetical protein [Bernardetia sp. MNP-M8]|uniref:hypothetical protein n=1 Tax=Bernardetia sp. MNP-M8 TaxID=3127470 RepID=UPI0030CBF390
MAKPHELKTIAIERNKSKEILKKSYYNYLSYNDKYTLDGNSYKGHHIIEDLGINVCPYCNRNFIYNINQTRSNYQLDHFYPKKKYPFLCISFYNLIPSCITCNGLTGKSDTDVKVNPYDDTFPFEKIYFELIILKPDFYYNIDSFDIKLNLSLLTDIQKHRFQTNIEAFNLEKHYQKHKEYVLKIIQKNLTYSDSYIENLYKEFEGTIFNNEREMKELITDSTIKYFHLRPLSKLTHDIAKELGLLD